MDKQQISNQHYSHLALDVYNSAKDAVKKRGRRLSWLRFARPTPTGWSFFRKKRIPWEVLDEIHQEVKKLHTACCTDGTVSEIFSQLINLSPNSLQKFSKSI